MRGDEEFHESGIYTEKILEQAPAKEGGYIKVKKIL
jgi:Asp-tRNA(Asn)/Glu-tRNA(Gln) amidotransferase C subunit